MRSREEIQRIMGTLANDPALIALKGDTFEYGVMVGKLVALGWVLGKPTADLSIPYRFDEWLPEQTGDSKGLAPMDET